MPKKTALYEEHVKLGGRIVDFAGWEMPVQYSGVIQEHNATRNAAGLFDVSHMGEFIVNGEDAEAFLNYAVTNDVSRLEIGQAQYTVMCHPHGGIVDDLVIYRQAKDRFFVVVNAANTDKDFKHLSEVEKQFIKEFETQDFQLSDVSDKYSQIAIQGPKAAEILQKITDTHLGMVKTYWFTEGKVCGDIPAILARTGYTGEDGFEIYCSWQQGPRVWNALLEAGGPLGLLPCGLASRDTLRTEMKYPLYGNELSDETNPLEAGLGWVTKLKKDHFVGREALLRIRDQGVERKLVGISLVDKGIPRHGYPILDQKGKQIGVLTSGTHSPALKESIAIGYVPLKFAEPGTPLQVEIRGKGIGAKVVETPFYKKSG